ncbi:MAG: pantoate--beta-alanine ligase [Chlorobium phaeobacteroides]|uniref:Pantothenate synthetase n=1 Tax=Chlorobium phaeobacteroides (strain BS1) TaxID=331678 RepID=PANC_CHLPB|nr:RecName: Full=Pantothenate synthetase; Short=PS; AltName: Full=Pantoate--beta-alanine ligase; AltName: Full=Pantoate-activating enzyme [Chlorobium phaeobacteroides BS1]MBC8524126.1 pantoate--beta-alanine ligase [Chlorobium phaeobacteroides]MBL6955756.1 pantoate--beta-alanine ligase [Chlorobium phaeobacteroides]NEX13863.1 pantoate--beta-alanine ligase [Prosthecochloris sp.]
MQIINDPTEMQKTAESLRLKHQFIAVVMTMGALHEGHLSLIKLAKERAGSVILTIFVNPRQFGPEEDFQRYPRPLEKDASMARSAGVDYLFAPDPELIYPEAFQTQVSTGDIATRFEGAARPGHFDGMATVVLKLLLLSKAHLAVFGEKDAQQLAVIKQMVRDFNIDTTILGAPTVRESDGLAISSRNIYLSSEERKQATVLNESMCRARELLHMKQTDCKLIIEEVTKVIASAPDAIIDYATIVDESNFRETAILKPDINYLLLLAVKIGSTRLIDNGVLRVSQQDV